MTDQRHKSTPGVRLRCAWEVYAGMIPLQPMPEYTRRWSLTSEAFEADPKSFDVFCDEVHNYAKALMGPPGHNWVRTEFVWM